MECRSSVYPGGSWAGRYGQGPVQAAALTNQAEGLPLNDETRQPWQNESTRQGS